VVFPSYIESHPMPLIETALFGLPLLVSDLDFSREVVGDYEGAKFLNHKDDKIWGDSIIEFYYENKRFPSYKAGFSSNWQTFFELINKSVS